MDSCRLYRFNVWHFITCLEYFYGGHIDPSEQEETWGVFNSVQGFGSMIGPLFGGLIAQFSNGLNNTFYVSLSFFYYSLFFMAFILSKVKASKYS